MGSPRKRPAHQADERTQLLGWFQLQRGIIRFKCEGLAEDDAHRSVLPTSPSMTVAGVVGHLRCTEELWFQEVLRGERGVGRGYGPDGFPADGGFDVDGVSLEVLLGEYDAECARSDAAIAAVELDASASTALHKVGDASLRWIVIHMIEETARHAGHLDLLRELLDGERGYY